MSTQGILLAGETFLAWEEPKDPDAKKDFVIDLSDDGNGGYLDGQTVASVVSITPETGSEITIGDGTNGAPAVNNDGNKIQFWVMGGIAGNWEITIRFTTSGGITDDITRVLQVKET
jgi:hypothetical protein